MEKARLVEAVTAVAARPGSGFVAIALLSLALNAWGITWGLPSVMGWAPDELVPVRVLENVQGQPAHRNWEEEWYPPLHFLLLRAAYAPALAFAEEAHQDQAGSMSRQLGWRKRPGDSTYFGLFLTGRILSLLMALGTLVALYRCTLRIADRAAARYAALILALGLPFAYYAKTANVDVPYTFWFAISLLAYLRVLERHALRDYLAFFATAVLAMATKDQAFALFILPLLHVVARLVRQRRAAQRPGGVAAALLDRRVLLAGSLGFVLLLAIYGIPFDLSRPRAHFATLTGPTNHALHMFPGTMVGTGSLFAASTRLVVFSLGMPAALACALGLALAGWRRKTSLLTLLIPGASYVAFFLVAAFAAYDRYFLPVAVLLAPFGGYALAEAKRASRGLGTLAVAGVVGYGLVRVVALDTLMCADGRYEVEAWMKSTVESRAHVAVVGPLEYLPRLQGLDWEQRAPLLVRLRAARPDYVVVNAQVMRGETDTEAREFYDELCSGAAGYALISRHRATRPWALDFERWLGGVRTDTNLAKIDPEIWIFRRLGR